MAEVALRGGPGEVRPAGGGGSARRAWARRQTLHVAVVYANPCRWQSRLRLFRQAVRHLRSLPNVKVYVGEVAYGDRPFEVTSPDRPTDFRFRVRDVLWHKENVLNQVIARFDPGWEYGAYCDGDVTFGRHDVALETVHQLQTYDWVQMFSTYCDLGPRHLPLRVVKSFAFRFVSGELDDCLCDDASAYGRRCPVSATGLAWAFRRDSFEACGRLLDVCILGSGDWHMAFGLAGRPDCHPPSAELDRVGRPYAEAIRVWQRRAQRAVRQNVGYVDCHVLHHFHGSKHRRGYTTRWTVLRDHAFDPYRDLFPDAQGLYRLTPDKPGLRDAVRRYFLSRSEDSTALYPPGDSFLVDVSAAIGLDVLPDRRAAA